MAETRRRHPEATGDRPECWRCSPTSPAGHIGPIMIENCERLEPDLVVYEVLNTGPGWPPTSCSIPAVAFSISLARGFFPMVHEATIGHQREQWTARGLEPPAGPLLAAALLDPVPPSLRPLRRDAADRHHRHPVGGLQRRREPRCQAWLAEPRTRPRVFLTLGTVSFGAVEVLRRADRGDRRRSTWTCWWPSARKAIRACLGDLLAPGRASSASSPSPGCCRLVDVMVHHGGTGSVLGRPGSRASRRLILPQGADQFVNADLLAAGSARPGRVSSNEEPPAGSDRRGRRRRCSGSRRSAAWPRRLRDEIAAMPSPAEVVDRLSALARWPPLSSGLRTSRSSPSLILRGVRHHAATHRVDHLAGHVTQRPRPGGVGDLTGEVEHLADPADEVAGGQAAVGEHLGQRAPGGPGEGGRAEPDVRFRAARQPGVALHQRHLTVDPPDLGHGRLGPRVRHPRFAEPLVGPPRLIDQRRQHRGQLWSSQRREDAGADALGRHQVEFGVDPAQHPARVGHLVPARRHRGSRASRAPGRSCRSGWRWCWCVTTSAPAPARSPAPGATPSRPDARAARDPGRQWQGCRASRSRSVLDLLRPPRRSPAPAGPRVGSRSISASRDRSAAPRFRRDAGSLGVEMLRDAHPAARPAAGSGSRRATAAARAVPRSAPTAGDCRDRRPGCRGRCTTAQPGVLARRHPDDVAGPQGRADVCSASARRSTLRSRAARDSSAPISARSRAYDSKSPRSQAAAAQLSAMASLLRATVRATPTTERSDWNWANDCSSSVRARSLPDPADQIDRHVVRRHERRAQRIGPARGQPGHRPRIETRLPEHHRVALDVDPAAAGPTGQLGELPGRDVGVGLAVVLDQFLQHDAAGRHVDAQRQGLGGEDDLGQAADERLLDALLEGRQHARRGGRRPRGSAPRGTARSRAPAGPRPTARRRAARRWR